MLTGIDADVAIFQQVLAHEACMDVGRDPCVCYHFTGFGEAILGRFAGRLGAFDDAFFVFSAPSLIFSCADTGAAPSASRAMTPTMFQINFIFLLQVNRIRSGHGLVASPAPPHGSRGPGPRAHEPESGRRDDDLTRRWRAADAQQTPSARARSRHALTPVSHEIEAQEGSAFLLTIAWSGRGVQMGTSDDQVAGIH